MNEIIEIGLHKQIKRAVEYAEHNIYNIDDLLDMMNGQMTVPSGRPEHLVLFSEGQMVCYYLVEHPNYGRCHYLSFTPNVFGTLPDKATLTSISDKFGIETPLIEEHILFNQKVKEVTVRMPIR